MSLFDTFACADEAKSNSSSVIIRQLNCMLQVSDADLIAATGKLLQSAVSAQQEVKRLLQQAKQHDVHGGKVRTTKDSGASGDLQVCISLKPKESTNVFHLVYLTVDPCLTEVLKILTNSAVYSCSGKHL